NTLAVFTRKPKPGRTISSAAGLGALSARTTRSSKPTPPSRKSFCAKDGTQMPVANTAAEIPTPREIEYLSRPAEVSMADRWFEIASIDHFWVLRRFEVLRKLAGESIVKSREMAEVGCGHGLLQKQIENTYAREVTGFDLNDYA